MTNIVKFIIIIFMIIIFLYKIAKKNTIIKKHNKEKINNHITISENGIVNVKSEHYLASKKCQEDFKEIKEMWNKIKGEQ